jgi:hypothetical protein
MMRKRIWSATCGAIALGLAVGLAAQQPPDSQPPAKSPSAKTVTVTGCIQQAQQSPTGTAGTAGATRSANETKFLLTSAALSPTSTAATPAPAATAVASEYRLDADDAKLTPHVGHKVEIAGTVEPASSTTQAPAASAANAPKLKVDTVKMLAATCP